MIRGQCIRVNGTTGRVEESPPAPWVGKELIKDEDKKMGLLQDPCFLEGCQS